MRYFSQGRFRQQVSFLQHQFLQDGNLPFSDIRSTEPRRRSLRSLRAAGFERMPTEIRLPAKTARSGASAGRTNGT
jgi:hypothetical protein